MGTNYFGENCVLRDRKLGKTYISKDSSRYECTDMLLHNLRDNFPQTILLVFVFFQVVKVVHSFADIVDMKQCNNKMMHRWKKERSLQSLHLVIILTLVWHHLLLTMMESCC